MNKKDKINFLDAEIRSIISPDIGSPEACARYSERLGEGKLTRDEDPVSHYCLYFLPYNPVTKQVFIVHHKKAGMWLSAGGHIDEGETLMQTLNRELNEELGLKDAIKGEIRPFLLSVTLMDNPVHPCKEHLDIWYRFPTDGADFDIDPKEFHATKWMTIPEARKIVTDPPNIEALDRMEKMFSAQ